MPTPPLIRRITDLETFRKKAEGDIKELRGDLDGLGDFVADEAKLRAIDAEHIRLLKEADKIHARRLGAVARTLKRQGRSK